MQILLVIDNDDDADVDDDSDTDADDHHILYRLQKQMKIMNRNLTGKLEEMNGMQNVDTHVALSGESNIAIFIHNIFSTLMETEIIPEIRGQLHELTRR